MRRLWEKGDVPTELSAECLYHWRKQTDDCALLRDHENVLWEIIMALRPSSGAGSKKLFWQNVMAYLLYCLRDSS